MAAIIFNLIGISFILAFITDISGVVYNIEELIGKWLNLKNVHIKILECSLCQMWWTGLIYLCITGNLSILYIAMVALISGFTFIWKPLYDCVYTLIIKLLNKLS